MILITGSDGFVGWHLTQHLQRNEESVIGYDLKNGDDLRNFERVWKPEIKLDQTLKDLLNYWREQV